MKLFRMILLVLDKYRPVFEGIGASTLIYGHPDGLPYFLWHFLSLGLLIGWPHLDSLLRSGGSVAASGTRTAHIASVDTGIDLACGIGKRSGTLGKKLKGLESLVWRKSRSSVWVCINDIDEKTWMFDVEIGALIEKGWHLEGLI
jgi:hypothetical protein